MKKKSVLIITLTMYIICMSFSASSAGTDYTAKPYDDDNDFTVSDISGGVTFVDGRECEMTKEEAQQAYIEELLYENRTEIFEKPKISLKAIVSTKINTKETLKGGNRRITPVYNNMTSSDIVQEVSGSETWSEELSAGADSDKIIEAIKLNFDITVGHSATKSVKTTVTIKPGDKFYVTFTPHLVKVTGTHIVSLHGGTVTNKTFTAVFPKLVNGKADGNVYYITKKI